MPKLGWLKLLQRWPEMLKERIPEVYWQTQKETGKPERFTNDESGVPEVGTLSDQCRGEHIWERL